jgi:hypothetical protein|tara:strand:+ start:95 stop:238 length:144 start_codon:yes stop_codon:yes gene_type:complete
MKIKVLAIIKNFISNKKKKLKQNNSKQNNLQYERNKYGFFSVKNKEN